MWVLKNVLFFVSHLSIALLLVCPPQGPIFDKDGYQIGVVSWGYGTRTAFPSHLYKLLCRRRTTSLIFLSSFVSFQVVRNRAFRACTPRWHRKLNGSRTWCVNLPKIHLPGPVPVARAPCHPTMSLLQNPSRRIHLPRKAMILGGAFGVDGFKNGYS